MPASFDKTEFFFPTGAVEGVLQPAHEVVVVGVVDVTPGEVGLHGDGAHVFDGRLDAEGSVDQERVFVNPLAVHVFKALPHRLDEPDSAQPFFQDREKAEGGGGFPVVLLGGGNEETRRYVIHG